MFIRKILFDERPANHLSFKDFLFVDMFNRKLLVFWLLAIAIKMAVFKFYYPHVAFINGDSYVYLSSAFHNVKIGTYPIGYPRFLRLLSVFSNSDFFLFSFQYLLSQAAYILLVFILFYYYVRLRSIQILFVSLLVISPLELYLSNYVSSDSLFLSLSVLWISSLICIINRPSVYWVVAHSLLIIMAFMVRYNALFYPFVSIIAFVIVRERMWLKLMGLLASFILIGLFVRKTSNEYAEMTGVRQFSPFSGWQLANNGIYIYYFVDSSQRKELPKKFKDLDMGVRSYFDTTRFLITNYPEQMLDISAQYMWDSASPLRVFMQRQYKGDSTTHEFVRWSKVAPLYGEYGKTLMKTYPNAFFKRFIWPNFIRYYVPPVEFLSNYGYRSDSVLDDGMRWFEYKSRKLETRFKDKSIVILNYYPIISGVLNAVFIMMSISFFLLNGISVNKRLFRFWVFVFGFWCCNLFFSVFASPIALRFQVFPILLCLVSNLLLFEFMLLQEKYKGKEIEGVLL